MSSRASEKCKFKHQISVLKTKNTPINQFEQALLKIEVYVKVEVHLTVNYIIGGGGGAEKSWWGKCRLSGVEAAAVHQPPIH